MNKKGWIRLVIVISLTWLMVLAGLAIYEKLTWEPTGEDLNGNQVFFYYYPDPKKNTGFIPLIKNFEEEKFIHTLARPISVLWAIYILLFFGGRWIYSGFKSK